MTYLGHTTAALFVTFIMDAVVGSPIFESFGLLGLFAASQAMLLGVWLLLKFEKNQP